MHKKARAVSKAIHLTTLFTGHYGHVSRVAGFLWKCSDKMSLTDVAWHGAVPWGLIFCDHTFQKALFNMDRFAF